MTKGRKRYDFKALNIDFNEKYRAWKEQPESECEKMDLYAAIYSLAFACISTSSFWRNAEEKRKACAHEYSFKMFADILEKKFVPEPKILGTDMPMNFYMSRNVLNTCIRYFQEKPIKNSELFDIIEDLEVFCRGHTYTLDTAEQYTMRSENAVTRSFLAKDLFNCLRLFYNDVDIFRMTPIASEMICAFGSRCSWSRHGIKKADNLNEEIIVFAYHLFAGAMRVAQMHGIHQGMHIPRGSFETVFHSALRSTMFLAAVTNTEYVRRELLLALDYQSLYRLAYLCGGRKIMIPTAGDLYQLESGVELACETFLYPTKRKEELLKNFGDKLWCPTSHQIASKALACVSVFKEDTEETPVLNVILGAINALDEMVNRMRSNSSDAKIQEFVKLSESLNNVIETITKLAKETKNDCRETSAGSGEPCTEEDGNGRQDCSTDSGNRGQKYSDSELDF